jgi:photosystem II stability/assembly factor-like uncharacterized protein
MKNTLLIFAMFLFIQTANAQWTIKHLDENSYNVGFVKFRNDSLGLFMGGGSTILKTTDFGETWNTKQLKINVNIADFQFIGDSTVMAIGDHYNNNGENMTSKLIKSKNLGESWDSIANFQGQQLRSLHFFNSDSGLLTGYDGIHRTNDGGITWDTVWSITQFGYKYGGLQQLYFPTSQTGYAIGTGRNQHNNPNFDNFLLKSTNSGISWDLIKTFSGSLTCINFVNESTGFIGTNSEIIYKTLDGGYTWTELPIAPNHNIIESIQFVSEMKGFATGGARNYLTSGGGSYFFISKTIDGGETWATFDTLGIPLNSIYFINDTIGFVSGNYELIMKSIGQIDKLPENYPWHLVESVGVDDNKLQNSNINIYPNPTDGILYIQSINSNNKFVKIRLTNVSGQFVDIGNIDTNNQVIQLNLSDLKSGIYILEIKYQDKVETMKILKK